MFHRQEDVIDEDIIERMVWDEHNKVKFSKLRLKWRIMKELNLIIASSDYLPLKQGELVQISK